MRVMRAATTLIGMLIVVAARAAQTDGGDASASAASYHLPLTRHSAMFGYVGLPGEPALGPPTLYLRQFSSIDDRSAPLASHWLEASQPASQVFTLGYVWRSLQLEGSAFSSREPERNRIANKQEPPRLDSASGRLSLKPAPNWMLQISRGSIGNLDQLQPNEDVRRTTISATYSRAFNDADWQTTFAWGRNVRKYQESTMGYLLESTFKLSNAHAFFGRLEQVGSDDLARDNDSVARQMFKMNKLTVGYFHDVRTEGPVRFDVGGLISRHLVPSTMTPAYGSEPTSYMMFVRLKLR